MSSKSDRSKRAGSGVAMSAGDANQDLQPIRFGSSESEAQVRSLLSKADTMRVRVRLADEQDVEGHLFGGGDSSLVLALQLSGDDDVEGHAISIHFPDAEQARRFRNELLAAGVLTATLAMGAGAGVALAPHQTGTATAPTQATVFMDTSAQAREGGSLTQSRTLSIPVGSASDTAQKARDAAAASGVTGPALKSETGSQSKGTTNAINPAAADAARTQAGLSGSLAGSSSTDTPTIQSERVREGGLLSEGSSVSTPQGATSQSAADQINAEIAGARAATPADAATQAREGGALSQSGANPMAAADAARTQAGITGSLAGSTTAKETPAIPQGAAPMSAADQINAEIAAARAGAQADASIPQAAAPMSAADQINAEIAAARAAATPAADAQTQAREGGALGETGVNPMAAADAARTQAGISGSLAGTPTGDASTKAREGGSLSQSTTSSPAVDYSGKPLPDGTSPSSPSSPSSPGVDYSGKPLPPTEE
jgi:hypothetical protein